MNIHQLFLITIFLLTIFLIIKQPKIKFKKRKIKLDYKLTPLITIFILLVLGYLSIQIIIDALLGNRIVPWEIILIFFTVAYIILSVDATGFLEYLSFKIVQSSKNNGIKLFFGLIVLAALLTIFTSNDIVILTLTPIIIYIGKNSKINPLPYLLAVFFTANTWSMFFYTDNPTDIMVAQAFDLGFLEYAKLMFFPTIFAGVSLIIMLFILFRKKIPKKIRKNVNLNPSNYIRSKVATSLSLILLGLFFILLLLSDFIILELWHITTIFAGIFLLFNLYFSYFYKNPNKKAYFYQQFKTKNIADKSKNSKTNEFLMVYHRMPWGILPLIASFFIIVYLFNLHGITDFISKILFSYYGIKGTVFTAFFSAIFANILINQPMTILFSNAIINSNYLLFGSNELSNGLALVIGSNLGGNLTIFGALSGIMWMQILKMNKIKMDYLTFLKTSLKIIPFVILISSLVLAIQMKFFFN